MRRVAAVVGALALAACSPAVDAGGPDPVARVFGSLSIEYYDEAGAADTAASILLQPSSDPAALAASLNQARFVSSPGLVLSDGPEDSAALELGGRFNLPILEIGLSPTPAQLAVAVTEVERLGATVLLRPGGAVPAEIVQAADANRSGDQIRKFSAVEAGTRGWFGIVADEATAAAIAPFAGAEGGTVLVAPEVRASAEAIAALSAQPELPVIGIGTGLPASFTWQVGTARAGYLIPGRADQATTEGRLYVALYGHPGAPVLGVLGEQGVDATIARAAEHASAYDPYTDLSLVPTLEIITTIADRPAGDDGNYSAESKIENIRPYVDAAARAGQYVLLDLQPGRTDFLTQAKLYEELLLRPNVGLALDPEWRLKPHQVHLTQIGSVGADEVNTVVSWLADLTRDNNLPQKIMVLHSFRTSMLQEIERVDTSRPELAVTIHVDGQGAQGAKVNTWNTLLRYAPNIEHWGWKNFYDEDTPQMLTPEETMATVQPLPLLISYQ